MDVLKRLEQSGIVPVVVLDKVEDAAPLAHALMSAGMKSAEVTFRTACAAECIAAMAEAEPEMCVGAGTVLTVEQVEQARAAGAKFIVSPGYNEDVVKHCIDIDLPVLPGTVTPSEVTAAENLGLKVTKFFPASQYGGLNTIKNDDYGELIVEGGVQSGETICVTCRDGKVELTVERGVPEKQAFVS